MLSASSRRRDTYVVAATAIFHQPRKGSTLCLRRVKGGQVYEEDAEGKKYIWGTVLEWDEAFEYFNGAWRKSVLPRLEYAMDVGPVDWKRLPKLAPIP
jgi:hypothetical protein